MRPDLIIGETRGCSDDRDDEYEPDNDFFQNTPLQAMRTNVRLEEAALPAGKIIQSDRVHDKRCRFIGRDAQSTFCKTVYHR